MKQNKYDDAKFFASYSRMPRSVGGLSSAGEWPVFRALLPDLRDKRVLDLGCGFGWHCRYAREQNAKRIVGVDLSENMLARAKAADGGLDIDYRLSAIEDIDFSDDEFDVVISSLALHYVERFDLICPKIHRCLDSGGTFVFSVEHPIFTALAAQKWYPDSHGERLHWPVDNYQDEGLRRTQWLADDVVKYHRTIATYVNTLLDCGFLLTKLLEPKPSPELLAKDPEMKDESRRPIFLLIAADKPLTR